MGRTTKRTWLFALALVAIVATTAACGDDDDGGGDGEQAQQSTTTTTESTTTTIAAEGPAEWVEVAQDIQNRVAELYANPDPERVRDVYAETCDCYQPAVDDLTTYQDRGTHWEGDPGLVVWVRHENTASGFVRLSVRTETTRIRIVDSNGEVLDESSDDEVGVPMCFSQQVYPDGPDGAYRVHDGFRLDGCPEESGP